MKQEDKARVVADIKRYLGNKAGAIELLDFLAQEEFKNAPAKPESELMSIFKNISRDEAREQIQSGSASRSVQNAAAAIRRAIQDFSLSTEARTSPVQIIFPRRKYRIHFVESPVSVNKFWKPYLDSERDLLILYPEHAFFRHLDDRYFVRHLDLNITQPEESALNSLAKLLPFLPPSDLFQPGRQFVSSGDAAAAIALTAWFERQGVQTTHSAAHHLSHITGYEKKNLIVFGNLRTYPPDTLEGLIAEFNFCVTREGVINRFPDLAAGDPEPTDMSSDLEPLYLDSFKAPGHTHGVIMRTRNDDLDSVITIISSNNGRFHETVVHSLTTEKPCSHLLRWLTGSEDKDFPDRFEAYLITDLPKDENTPRPANRLHHKAKRTY